MKPDVETSLERISKSLARSQDDREFLLRNTREIIVLCSKSIIATHRGDAKSARASLRRANTLLKKYRSKAAGDLARHMLTPEQEYTEAACLIAISEGRPIPSDESLGVMQEAYVLGLFDCIGEMKRMILDMIRTGQTDKAAGMFDAMEGLYVLLYPFSMYDKVLKEARRKADIARSLVDDARGAVTEEARRAEMASAISKIERYGAGDGI